MAADSPTEQDALLDMADALTSPGEASPAANRRQHVRVRPDQSNPLSAGLASGADVTLLDLSRGGAQFECDRRLLPNSSISLRLVTRDETVVVSARVLRSRIVRLRSGTLGYVVAVAFNETLKTRIEGPESVERPSAPVTAMPAAISEAADSPPVLPAPMSGSPDRDPVDEAPTPYVEPDLPASALADISDEEALAFESTFDSPLAMLTMTASVDTTSGALRDMFNGNDW